MEISESMSPSIKYSLLQVASERFSNVPSSLTESELGEARKIARNKCFIQERVLSSPESVNVVIPADQVDDQIKTIISRFPDELSFETELANNNLTIDDFHHEISQEIRVETILDKVGLGAPPVSDEDVKLHYYLHSDKYHLPETRQARHILITINDDFPENRREAAFERLLTLSERLKKKPKRFEEQATKHSECPTAMDGGMIGRVKKGVLFPVVEKALFELGEGEVSDIVESPVGLHIVYCEKIFPEGTVPLQEVIENIREKLTERNQKIYQKNWLKGVLKQEPTPATALS